jgi:hypothetical protein
MVIEVPRTGERFNGRLVEEPCGPLCLKEGRSCLRGYVLKTVLDIGWRVVESTRHERILMESYGISIE